MKFLVVSSEVFIETFVTSFTEKKLYNVILFSIATIYDGSMSSPEPELVVADYYKRWMRDWS